MGEELLFLRIVIFIGLFEAKYGKSSTFFRDIVRM